jgi:hypothetical protein
MSNSDDDDNFKMIITQISSHQDNESISDRKSIFGDLSPLSPFSPTLDVTTKAAENFDQMSKKRKI